MKATSETRLAICPRCGCSLARLGVDPLSAATARYGDRDLAFCCDGCRDEFLDRPDFYVARTADLVVCPGCLAEKHRDDAEPVAVGEVTLFFCGCPGCVDPFRAEPHKARARLSATGSSAASANG